MQLRVDKFIDIKIDRKWHLPGRGYAEPSSLTLGPNCINNIY